MIPLIDLNAQYRSIKHEIDSAITGVLETSQFILGPEVAAFESEFAAYCGAAYGIGVNSGTSALHLALLAAGVGPGDEVITVPFTFLATVAAIRYAGARPVLVDIDPKTFNIDPSLLEEAISARTKVIVPVHLYGQCADMDPILAIARKHRLVVIEDAAQAHGAEYKRRRAGSLADMACFSFYPTKNLGAIGEGGMVVTSNFAYAEKIRSMRDWGQTKKYEHGTIGFNYRMEGIQGAILRVKLRHLERWTEVRRARAALYNQLLHRLDLTTPKESPYARHVYHCYVIRSAEREALIDHLRATGIQTAIHYPIPVHLQQAYADLDYHRGDFPQSEAAAREVLSLPMHGDLTTQDVQTIASAIETVCSPAASVSR